MNILQILPELNYGGVETGTLDLAKYLISHNHKAIVVSAGGEQVRRLESFGAAHYTLNVRKKSLFSMLAAVPELVKIIRKEDIQLVHARSRVPGWIAYFACRLSGVPFITTCHGYYSKHLFTRVMGWGKFVIVPSQAVGRRMIDDFGVIRRRIRLIPRSVDTEKFVFTPMENRSHTEFVVAVIARIVPLKGHVSFIKAIHKVYRVIPNIRVWIVGGVPAGKPHYKDELDALIRRFGLGHIVEFIGAGEDIPGLLSKINLLALPTVSYEAFGRVIVEAFASGVPVVATRISGVVDIIEDGVDGILAAPGDPDSMAEGIIRVLKDPELSNALVKNAYLKVISKFTLEKMAQSTLEAYQEAIDSKRILIIKLSALGDLILSIPALRALRKKFPHPSRISCVTGKDAAPLLSNCPYIDEIIIYDFKRENKGFRQLEKLGGRLRGINFDLSIDLQNNRKSHILSALSFAPRRYGYDNGKFSFLLNKRVKEGRLALEPVEHQFRILDLLNIALKDRKIEFWPSKEDIRYVNDFLDSQWLDKNHYLIGIHLGSSKRWITKRWPLTHIARLAESLSLMNMRIVLTGEKIEGRELNDFEELTKKSKPIIACGKTTINQLVCLIKRCSVFICGDTAPLHMAIGLGVAVVALFGPTDPKRHLPQGENIALITKGLPCQPCYKAQCRHINCMKQISPLEIKDAVLRLLSVKELAS